MEELTIGSWRCLFFPNSRAVLAMSSAKDPGAASLPAIDDWLRCEIAGRVAKSFGGDVVVEWSEPSWTFDAGGVSRVARVRLRR